jgi:hypothetical protein
MYPTDKADRGRHPDFARHECVAGGPGSLSLSFGRTKEEAAVRRVSCDHYEFDPPDSEQSLELALAAPSPRCPNLAALLATCGATAQVGSAPPPGWLRWHQIVAHLESFVGVSLQHTTRMREVALLRDDWDDLELGLAFESVLVWYHWSTSA